MHRVVFDSKTIEFLEKTEKTVAKRIYDKISSTKSNPHHFWERLTGRKDYKLRVGNYRVIADIDDNSEVIYITLIGHRKNVYKNI
ncbi:type II toxin-antitoxin system RelE/ParE family toxin [Candidatus Woesearchaeota archaeon]|nr:type II toxin-antitoxin system RelE/ParE family toxin [Candidatus Woesearchaeota archaeon]